MTEYPVYTGMKSAGPALLQWLGLVAAVVALPIFILGGFSLLGYVVGVLLFAANRAGAILLDRLARGKMQVTAVGITGMGFISRAWITFGLLFAFAEWGSKDAAVPAAISFLVYFTVDTMARSIAHVAAGGLKKNQTQETA
jgi:hypothetical protein